jgi:2-dehydro-3-deoxyphosphooctonate aldolase (KDO 8-P synthase)
VAVGVDAVFLEIHPDPDKALCDGPNQWPLGQARALLRDLGDLSRQSREAAKKFAQETSHD